MRFESSFEDLITWARADPTATNSHGLIMKLHVYPNASTAIYTVTMTH
jgi:hypothetical protein